MPRPRDWREWAELFTEDAEYLEHTFGRFKGRERDLRLDPAAHESVAELRDDRVPPRLVRRSTRSVAGGSARSRTGSGTPATAACTRRTT